MVEGEEEGDGQKEEGSRLFIIEDTFLLLPPKQSAVTAHLTVSIFMCVAVNFYNDALQMQTADAHVCTLSSVNYHRICFQVVASEPKKRHIKHSKFVSVHTCKQTLILFMQL